VKKSLLAIAGHARHSRIIVEHLLALSRRVDELARR
jgi:hypothetical protein